MAPKPYTGVQGPYKIPLEKWPETIKVNIPSIIIADAGLGTINSTVLTIEYMRNKNLKINGVILNRFEITNEMHDDNKKMIEDMTGIKIIGVVMDGVLKLADKNLDNLFE